MRLHYKGKYNSDPDSLPRGEHQPGAVQFKEAEDSKRLALIANIASIVIMVLLAVPAYFRCREYILDGFWQMYAGLIVSLLSAFPHELLHAVCFKEDVYLYTNLKQGMLFVIGPETMTRRRFVFLSMLPNVVFGIIPYIIGMIFPQLLFFVGLGVLATGMGAGDYYNVFNAMTQMPKGARTYMHGFHSYWYMPDNN